MDASFLDAPHPHLKEPVLYIADVPDRVKWGQLEKLLSLCGRVRCEGRTLAPGTQNKTVKVVFSSVFYAEMAIATLSGVQMKGITPIWHMFLSHSPSLEATLPKDPLIPMFIRSSDTKQPMPINHDVQTIFTWFRQAGPLVSVRSNVDIGYGRPACTVQYWREDHLKFAKKKGPEIHAATRELKFTLQQYDAWNLYCARLGTLVTKEMFAKEVAKYGKVLDAHLVKPGHHDTFGFVSYDTQETAFKAMREMHGRKLGDRELFVRYHEPKDSGKLRPHKGSLATRHEFALSRSPRTTPASNETSKSSGRDSQNAQQQKQTPKQTPKQTSKQTSEQKKQNLYQEEERLREQKLSEVRVQRTLAEAVEASAKQDKEAAWLEQLAKSERFRLAKDAEKEAQNAHKAAEQALEAAKLAFAATQTCLDDATAQIQKVVAELATASTAVKEAEVKEAEAKKQSEDLRRAERELQGLDPDGDDSQPSGDAVEDENIREQETFDDVEGARRREAEEEELRKRTEELREREEAEREETARKSREEELAESRRKMAEFEAEEKRRKREKEEAEARAQEAARRAKEERERREREEAERKVREEREREEREKKEAEERQKRYNLAYWDEKTRCRRRDEARWTSYLPWTTARSIDRFRVVGVEFDDIKFSATQPLTFDSIPWPTLHSPYKIKFDDIEWQAVEDFFKKLQLATNGDEYKTLVEKAHRRFHPDKWRSRGLLNTILDESLREQMENAGNIVAQALTPIWLASRGK